MNESINTNRPKNLRPLWVGLGRQILTELADLTYPAAATKTQEQLAALQGQESELNIFSTSS